MRNFRVSFYLFLFAVFLVNFCPVQTMAIDGPGVYCASKITSSSPNAANELRQSGFEWVCVWTLHIYPDGHLVFNSDYDVTNSSGTFVANQFASEIARLKTAPTSVQWVEVGLSGWGSGSFDAVRDLVASEGTGTNSSLYKNFKALYDAVPQIDALSIDDESTYHEPSTTQFAIMLADIGFKVSVCPYTQVNHWQNVVANTNAARPGTIEDVHIQCYAGGSGNNPCTWDGYFAPEINVMPGVEPGSVASKMSNWNSQCGIAGGWIWAYDGYYGQLSTVQGWASDISNNTSGGTPPPPTANNVAPDASVTVSSEYPDANYSKAKVNDGVKSQHANGEWASNGETTPWAQLSWNQGVTTSKVILYDRPNSTDQISSGTLTFSDGSSVSVGALPNNGTAHEVTFSERTITWVKFQVDNGSGYNVGLSEFEVVGEYGTTPPPPTANNLAPDAGVSVSSEYPDANYSKAKVNDGVKMQNSSGEWASNGETTPWAQLSWNQGVTTSKVILYDRPNSTDQISSGTLTFSNGSSVSVGALPNNGAAQEVTFSERTITWVKFKVDNGSGYNVGLSEFEVIGEYGTTPPPSSQNLALNASATASTSWDNSFLPNLANDGNSGTRWASQAQGTEEAQWIAYDLGATYFVESVSINWEAAYSIDFNIQIHNGNEWVNVTGVTANDQLTNGLGINQNAQKIRLMSWKHIYQHISIWEFEVIGSSAKSAQIAPSKTATDQSASLKVYPNPASDKFIVDLGVQSAANLSIYDISGRLVLKDKIVGKKELSIGNLSVSGILLVKVETETDTFFEKVVVK